MFPLRVKRGPSVANVISGKPPVNKWKIRAKRAMENFESKKFSMSDFPVTREMIHEEYVEKFKSDSCKGLGPEDCIQEFMSLFHKTLKSKYISAVIGDVDESLRLNPEHSQEPKFIELAFIFSHNFHVEEEKKKWIRLEREEIRKLRLKAESIESV